MLDTNIPIPPSGRTFSARRRIRLSDMDAHGRLRLDAVARFLQDTAIDDVQETGWGMPEHLWVVRRIRLDVHRPFLADTEVVLTTWSSGRGAIAAARRWSLAGDGGGQVEVDSVWIHLDAEQRPARIDDFGVYAEAAGDRVVSATLELPDPPVGGKRIAWLLRDADVDLHGHVNNAVHWQAVEDVAVLRGFDLATPHRAELDYRQPLDRDDHVELVVFGGEATCVAFVAGDAVKAVARLERLA